ncbi:hypothetical protein [Pseudodesulfovibrio pelocollis]|uniref:hypothetical protein n=1 Tax=Pseudodesulfovibrio pelocollis TaxID=3051432 RepID=UPI00255AE296|nr:hypothetical protein [Pseudodesulfovibrio sp. SB368]
MYKVKDEKAWVSQAVFDPEDDTCIKCLWVGSLESCKAVAARILDRGGAYYSAPRIEFGEGETYHNLAFPMQGRSRIRTRLNSNFFMEGILCHDKLEEVVSGSGAFLYDQVFSVLKGKFEIPVLREWVPDLFEAALSSGMIARLEVVGENFAVNRQAAYHISMHSNALEEMLLEQLPKFSRQAQDVIMAAAS